MIKYELDINVYNFENWLFSIFFTKVTCAFLLQENIKKVSDLKSFKPRKTTKSLRKLIK